MNNLDGYDLLNDALACAYTGHPEAREVGGEIWVPASALSDYDLETSAAEAAAETGDTSRALFEMVFEYLGCDEDPIWQQLEEAAGRALRKFAEEIDEEYSQAFEDEDEEDAE